MFGSFFSWQTVLLLMLSHSNVLLIGLADNEYMTGIPEPRCVYIYI